MIRLATQADIQAIARMGRSFWAQMPYPDVPYCPDSAAATCHQMLAQGLLLYGEVDGTPAATAGALMAPLIVNRSYMVAAEILWWVEPGFRQSGIGKEMLTALENAARESGARRLSMMAVESIQIERAAAIYESNGYTLTERTWNKSLWQQ